MIRKPGIQERLKRGIIRNCIYEMKHLGAGGNEDYSNRISLRRKGGGLAGNI